MTSRTAEWIARQNIERFRRKIEQAKSAEERAQLQRLLDAETRRLDRAAKPPKEP